MQKQLTMDEARQIYDGMINGLNDALDEKDQDIIELYEQFFRRAFRYTGIRAGWNRLLTFEERREQDELRTQAHDAFISSVEILIHIGGDEGKKWEAILGGNRKRIGDLAGYITLFESLESR